MNNKLLLERKIIKEFMSGVVLDMKPINKMEDHSHAEVCHVCHCMPCECPHDSHEDHQHDHGHLTADQEGVVSPEELYSHFDLDGDEKVTLSDYAEHIDYHCENPETLDVYRDKEGFHKAPCQTSYKNSCETFKIDPECVHSGLSHLMDKTRATCPESLCLAILDFLKGCK